MNGCVFPGQGSQYVGMGRSLYDSFSKAKEIFDRADDILGLKISNICFNGPEETLRQTYITQPAIFVHSTAAASVVKERIGASCAAGHSLGEYSALVFAGALSFEDGLQLVILRGKLMQRAGEKTKGTMAAVIGLNSEKVERICTESSDGGVAQVANYNSPGQLVISGDVQSVRKAMDVCKKQGAKLVKELAVHGAFHSSLMNDAAEELKAALDTVKFSKLNMPVFMNVDAMPADENTPEERLRQLLHLQITSPVRWEDTIKNMISGGIDNFVELGPGKVLQGLVKRIDGNVKTQGFDKDLDFPPA